MLTLLRKYVSLPSIMEKHIHPIFDQLLQQKHKEVLLQQHGLVLWLTGLSGSGKSTVAKELEKILHQQGFLTSVLDGDNIRSGINNNLGFSPSDRQENIRRIAEVAKLFRQTGIVTICSFVSPTRKIRQSAKSIIGAKYFYEVYIDAPLEVCEQRDVKGLYKKARAGIIKQFTGIDAPFEAPINPDVHVETHKLSIKQAANKVLNFVLPLITYTKVS
jgi:adenylylsulfate kinase